MHASELAHPKSLTKFCRDGLRGAANASEEVRFANNPIVEYIFKLKLNSESDQGSVRVYISRFLQKSNESHLADHCAIRVTLADSNAEVVPPYGTEWRLG